jgi:hypothetical protein
MPANESAGLNAQMADLASTGEAGVLKLAGMMVPPGDGSNARVEFALSALSNYVTAEGRQAERLVTSNAYVKALQAATDREVKAFLIRQIGRVGKDEAVDALTALLDDEELEGPAKAALTSIGALPYEWMPTGANAPYSERTLAFSRALAAKPDKATKQLQKALKDDDRRYRFAAMEISSKYADAAMYGKLVKSLPKLAPKVRTDVLNWLSEECDLPGRRAVIAPIAGDVAIAQLSAVPGDADLTSAAAGLLVKTGGEKAINALASMLADDAPEFVAIGAKALASTAGDISSAVAPMVAVAGDTGKAAALNLLAARKSSANAATVFGQLDSASPDVKAAAYAALKDVATATDLDRLYTLLENAAPENAASVQQAISSALHTLSPAEQYDAASRRMNSAPAANQYLYYPVLAATGDARALGLVVERFAGESGAAKEAAFDALISWNGVDAADKLLVICNSPAEEAYFDRAITRLTRLVAASSLSGEERRARLVEAMEIAATGAQKSAILRAIGETNSYPGMVKAGEYLDDTDKAVQQAAASSVMKIALGNPQFTGAEVRTLLDKVISVLDNPDAGYEQQAIRKHLSEMPADKPFELSDAEKAEGFKVLFDGTNLDQWTGNKEDYRVQSGTITLYPGRSFGGNLYTAKEYGNFVYRFEFMLTPGANNGVGIRTPRDVDAAYHGMEIQILDHDDPAYRGITTHQVHGSVYGVIGARRAVLRPEGEWNVEEIVADGDRIKVTLNGEVILDGNIREAAKGGTFDGLNHPGLFNKKGYIGFLGHGSELKFRNIRIKELR